MSKIKLELSEKEVLMAIGALRNFAVLLESSSRRPGTRKKLDSNKTQFLAAAREAEKLAEEFDLALKLFKQTPALAIVDGIINAEEVTDAEVESSHYSDDDVPVGHDDTEPECQACGSSSCICPTEREVPICGEKFNQQMNPNWCETCTLPKGHDGRHLQGVAP